MMQGNGSFGGFDLQGPLRVHQQQHHHQQNPNRPSMVPPTIHENFPLTIRTNQDCDQTVSLIDFNTKPDRGKCGSDDDEPSFTEDCGDNRDQGKGKRPSSSSSTWHRVKWTDDMVRLLITAVSYITEDVAAAETSHGLRKKCSNLQKKGKWKSVSKVMAERGHFVSPQQCEDKFNDLNKRYKRLNEILGRGTSCEVVENPALLDVMDHVPEKAKEEVRKILSSKHLHYEEMCSYHNGNRLHLPPDPELQRSLRMALHSREDLDEIDAKRSTHPQDDENDEVDEDSAAAEFESSEDNHQHTFPGNPSKRTKPSCSNDHFTLRTPFNFPLENGENDGNQGPPDGHPKSNTAMNQHRHLQLEEQRIHLDMQKLELEKERFKWQRFCRKKDRELEIMKMEIERMKLENERLALELRRKELGMDNN